MLRAKFSVVFSLSLRSSTVSSVFVVVEIIFYMYIHQGESVLMPNSESESRPILMSGGRPTPL